LSRTIINLPTAANKALVCGFGVGGVVCGGLLCNGIKALVSNTIVICLLLDVELDI
jgi:hypothetical protein